MNMNGPWYEDSMWQDWNLPWFAVDAHGHVALFWTNLTDWAPFELTEMNPDDGILEELVERPRTSRALLLRPAGSGTWGEPAAAAERGVFVYEAEHDVGYVLVGAPETPASFEALEPWSRKLSPRCRYPTASWHQMSVVSPSLVAPLR